MTFDDHFWPSIYPALIVGFLIGLSRRSLTATLLGACGGFLGGFLTFYILTYFRIEEGIFPVIAIIFGAATLANFCLKAGLRIMGI
ncbi:MAG: hypothetical protein ACKOW3_06350 [Hyphomicrobium sp.]